MQNTHDFYTILILAFMGTVSIAISGFSNDLELAVRIGLLVIALFTIAFAFLLHFRDVGVDGEIDSGSGVKGKFKVSGIQKTRVYSRKLKGENKSVQTTISVDSPINQYADVSDDEQAVRVEMSNILGNELTQSNVEKALDLLESFNPKDTPSFRHFLNKARLLGILGEINAAEKTARDVVKDYANNDEAVGTAYEVLSWIEEFREPGEKDLHNANSAYLLWLKKRKSYITKGLKRFNSGHTLLMNAFEVSVLENNTEEAMNFLTRAFLSNKDKTEAKLAVSPLLQEAKRLSPELNNMIQEIIKGEFDMKVEPKANMFQTIKGQVSTIFLMAVITLLLPGIIFQQTSVAGASVVSPHSGNSDTLLAKCDDGTEIGKG